jgi:predicted NUDIX family NTP pyrophosphohydrolase
MSNTSRVASAGIAVVRATDGVVEVLVGHLGGPFWAKKTDGAWSFPKGLCHEGEHPIDAAWREFQEETGLSLAVERDRAHDLGTVSTSAKTVQLFAVLANPDVDAFAPGTFELEWPPRSGRRQTFPEIDRLAWADLNAARAMLSAGQRPFVDRIETWVTELS